MDKFNVGDKIIFDRGDVHNKDCFLGIIIRKNQDLTYHVLYFDDYEKVIDYNVKCQCITSLEDIEHVRCEIEAFYDGLIKIEKAKLMTISQKEKDKEKIRKYNDIKNRIRKNCEWLINEDLDDEDFIDRIKEISRLKKQLFSIDLSDCVYRVRKHNGIIKYKIKQLEEDMVIVLSRISDEKIKREFENFE